MGGGGRSIVQGDPDLHSHLPVGDFAVLNVAPGFNHLKLSHLALVDLGPSDGVLNRRLDARM